MSYDIQTDQQPKRRGRPPKARPAEVTPLVPIAADDYRQFMQHCALRLELALKLKPGVMDSESRHLELANQLREIVQSVADELRSA
jgi:hypothetical protein